ncbi:MAG TPA: HAD family phosphatase [Candidatus Saccharimonadales bacterium]|nr:HAD family phosphatase [Candidatus Saccharimonadales bacterium]
MHMVKAVIFDYGKVLSLPPTLKDWQAMSSRFGKPLQEFQAIYWGHREELDRGTLDNIAYWKKVGGDCGLAISDDEARGLIDQDNAQWTNECPEMLEFARDLHAAGYKTAILSNMQHEMLAAMRQKFDWLGEFDVQIYSCEVRLVKPALEIYGLCCARLGCKPEESLFLDDKKVNTDAAKKAGMQSYVFHSAVDPVMLTGESEITVGELRALLLKKAGSAEEK